MNQKRQYAKGLNPELLKWSRETIRYSVPEVASRMKVAVEQVQSWESGQSLPTIKQAMELGKFYHRPWAIFFLAKKPTFQILQDFRKVAQGESGKYSPRLSIFLNEAKEQQEWASDYLKASSLEKNKCIGSWSNLKDSVGLAKKITEVLTLDYAEVAKLTKRFPVFKYYQKQIETQGGIFVGKTTAERIEVDEMRGVYLHDEYAPMVFVNSTDSVSAQIFTLFHEVAHAFLGKEGVSNIQPLGLERENNQDVETFCNRVASEVVLPTALLVKMLKEQSGSMIERVKNISLHFKVSEEMIGIKLSLMGIISDQDLRDIKQRTREFLATVSPTDFGNYHLNRFSRNGQLFTHTVLSAYKSGDIMSLDAAKLLNIKTSHIEKQMTYAFQ